MAGNNTLHAEVVLSSELSILLLSVIIYYFVDGFTMGAQSIIVPYLYFICIPLGIIIELSAFHANRVYVDVLASIVLFVTVMICLPIHFWKNTSEFMKRRINELPKATSKHWEIESYITKREKGNNLIKKE